MIYERTRFFIKNIPLTLYSRKGCERVDVGCVWEGSWRREQTATYWPQVLRTIAALLSHFSGLLNRGNWGPQALSLQADSHAGILSPTATGTELQLELQLIRTELTDQPNRL